MNTTNIFIKKTILLGASILCFDSTAWAACGDKISIPLEAIEEIGGGVADELEAAKSSSIADLKQDLRIRYAEEVMPGVPELLENVCPSECPFNQEEPEENLSVDEEFHAYGVHSFDPSKHKVIPGKFEKKYRLNASPYLWKIACLDQEDDLYGDYDGVQPETPARDEIYMTSGTESCNCNSDPLNVKQAAKTQNPHLILHL